MKQNDALGKIAQIMSDAESILFLTHMIVDGDSAGSSAALCNAMKDMGKISHIYGEEKLPNNLLLLSSSCFIEESQLLDRYDLVVSVDCSDKGRFKSRQALFDNAPISINIDHHKTNDYFGDYNYIDPKAAATGEIIYDLLKTANWQITKTIAESLYVAIVTDTGQFQYSNTTAKTHQITADLYECGIDTNEISIFLYQSDRKEKILATSLCLQTVEFIQNGKGALAYITEEMLTKISAKFQDTDGMVEMLRNVGSVEVAIFVKEIAPGVMKVGFRSKRYVDVAEIAAIFGGGGHKRAAGCTISGNIDDVKRLIYPAVEERLV